MKLMKKTDFNADMSRHIDFVALVDNKGCAKFYNSVEEIEPWLLHCGQLAACLSLRLDYTPGEGLKQLYQRRFGNSEDTGRLPCEREMTERATDNGSGTE
jgi:hypothetical protein